MAAELPVGSALQMCSDSVLFKWVDDGESCGCVEPLTEGVYVRGNYYGVVCVVLS